MIHIKCTAKAAANIVTWLPPEIAAMLVYTGDGLDVPDEHLAAVQAVDKTKASIPVPSEVTPLQIRRALRSLGLKDAVDAFVATMTEEEQEAWEYCVGVLRDDPIIKSAAAAMDKTTVEVDDLFRLAATL